MDPKLERTRREKDGTLQKMRRTQVECKIKGRRQRVNFKFKTKMGMKSNGKIERKQRLR